MNRLVQGDGWDFKFAEYCIAKDGAGDKTAFKIIQSNLEKRFTVKDTGATHRLINHWAETGLISDAREDEQGWRKFSFVDLIWVHVLMEMRKFGMPLKAMKLAYQSTFFSSALPRKGTTVFEFSVFRSMLRDPMHIVVYSDGWCEYLFKQDYEFNLQFGLLDEKSYLIVNLSKCVRAVLPGVETPSYPISIEPTSAELEVIRKLREGNLDELKIRLNDGRVHSLASVYKTKDEIEKLLNQIEYGELTIKRQKGQNILVQVSELNRIDS